jgi:phospholipid transport system substrate-binding protein
MVFGCGRVAGRFAGSLAVVILSLIPAASIADMGAPEDPASRTAEQQVVRASDDVVALIEVARGYAKEDPERFYREVEALLRPVVDFDSFARSVMAVYYKQANDEQRRRFADTFRWGLVRTYALALIEFNDEGEVVLVPPDRPPRSPKRQTVKMEIRSSSGEVYPVLYSMGLGKDGIWRVRNIIVNGINMGLTYRNQFASAMNDQQYGGDMDRVIDAWGELLAADEAAAEEAAESQAPASAEESGSVGDGDQAGLSTSRAQGAILPIQAGPIQAGPIPEGASV